MRAAATPALWSGPLLRRSLLRRWKLTPPTLDRQSRTAAAVLSRGRHQTTTTSTAPGVGVSWASADGEAAGATVRTTTGIAVARICFELDLLNGCHGRSPP